MESMGSEDVVETMHTLFDTIEARDWEAAGRLLDDRITLDHSSLSGGSEREVGRAELLEAWRCSLHAGKRTFHTLSRFRVEHQDSAVRVTFSAYVVNVLDEELGGGMWEAWGRHIVTLRRRPDGWRAVRLVFEKAHTRGDERVYRHTAAPAGEGSHAR
ncbi:nuclear transport factor 2 family protein [Streptomyces sp. NPDC056347]|uniref:nuclear transport factor 2 family protein n=1 Tax=Streptomyces sp. NPDC056347 TaxID=3345790 RepID=UPI0035DB16DC